jgi:hypothetical protein
MAIRDLREYEYRFGVKNVRSTPESRHWMTVLKCPLWAKSGHDAVIRSPPRLGQKTTNVQCGTLIEVKGAIRRNG